MCFSRELKFIHIFFYTCGNYFQISNPNYKPIINFREQYEIKIKSCKPNFEISKDKIETKFKSTNKSVNCKNLESKIKLISNFMDKKYILLGSGQRFKSRGKLTLKLVKLYQFLP